MTILCSPEIWTGCLAGFETERNDLQARECRCGLAPNLLPQFGTGLPIMLSTALELGLPPVCHSTGRRQMENVRVRVTITPLLVAAAAINNAKSTSALCHKAGAERPSSATEAN